jgi:atypical dual specificity phosphatase
MGCGLKETNMMKFTEEKAILPSFPKTPHLPHKPNTDKQDTVATEFDVAVIWTRPINVEEKIDGASCGMGIRDGEPLIRNRDHVLRKGYHKKTAAKMQFASVWNWWYDHKKSFESLAEIGPYSVFGEWCVAQHGIHYTRLPDWFIAYDIYDYEKRLWLPPPTARRLLQDAGFVVPCFFWQGQWGGEYANLEGYANADSLWADSKVEGIYVKVYDDKEVTHRFKMVREDYVRGALWNPTEMKKNGLSR